MYVILSVTNSSPTITKDANEWQYFEAFLKLKNKALDGKLHLQKHKPKSLSLCPCFVFNSSILNTCLKNSVYSSFSTIVIIGVRCSLSLDIELIYLGLL